MTANVTIDVATVKDVLRIPNAALRFRPENAAAIAPTPPPEERAARAGGGPGSVGAARQFGQSAGGGGGKPKKTANQQTVYTIAADGIGDPKPVSIKTGISDGRFTQVASGELKPGETVVVGLATTKADATGARPAGGAPGGGRRPF
jgi:HlyD family secretion protein